MKLSDELRGASRIIWHRQAIGSFIEPPPISTVAIDCAADELDRLQSALPKTADGVTIVPGMEVWVVDDCDRCVVVSVTGGNACAAELRDYEGLAMTYWWEAADDLYSTREAAEEAAKT